MTRLCEAVLRSEQRTEVRCMAEADDSGFCPVHRRPPAKPVVPTPRAQRRDLTRDVLPWSAHDEHVFRLGWGNQHARRSRR